MRGGYCHEQDIVPSFPSANVLHVSTWQSNLVQGKKGIALTTDQFSKLKHAAEQLTRALQASDTSCSHALGEM